MDFDAIRAMREYEMPPNVKSYKIQLFTVFLCWETLDDEAFPSEETLAKWCGCGVSTVRTAVHKLQTAGLLTIRRAIPDGSKALYPVNHYGAGQVIKQHIYVQVKDMRRVRDEKKNRQKLPPDSTGTAKS